MAPNPTIRVVLAKVGLDGHDRGIKVVARGLRDAGMHVVYGGLWQSPEAVVRMAAEEDAHFVGLSILSGAHMTLVPRVLQLLRKQGLQQVGLLVGGIIPEADVPALLELGVARIFGPGTPIRDVVEALRAEVAARRAADQEEPAEDVLQLVDSACCGQRLALARLLSILAAGQQVAEIRHALSKLKSPVARCPIVAVTGSGGVGKSTLVGRLIPLVRASGRRLAVLACDPQSPLTGGALLGDRVRMPVEPDDEGLLVRSLAVPSGRQAIADNLDVMAQLIGRAGYQLVLVETAGAGQADTAVARIADRVVLVVQPQAGDQLQWQKAGVLEIADAVVVNKGDLPGAEQVATELRDSLNLAACHTTPVLRTSAAEGEGVDQLWAMVEQMVWTADRDG